MASSSFHDCFSCLRHTGESELLVCFQNSFPDSCASFGMIVEHLKNILERTFLNLPILLLYLVVDAYSIVCCSLPIDVFIANKAEGGAK